MGKTLTEPAATPYAEALLLCDNKHLGINMYGVC